MARQVFKALVPLGLIALLWVALFGGYLTTSQTGWLRLSALEIQAACRDTGTQWMVVVCLLSYFVTFLILERRLPQRGTGGTKGKLPAHPDSLSAGAENRAEDSTPHPPPLPGRGGEGVLFRGQVTNPDFWLVGFVVIVLLQYAVDYTNAAKSLQVVLLLAGIVIGKGVALWAKWGEHRTLNSKLSTLNRRQASHCILVFLLAAASLWQPEMGMEFHYRGVRRWEGVWDNPNTYGLLMGVGLVLAIGLLVPGSGFQVPSERRGRLPLTTRHMSQIALLVAAVLCGFGLLKSYSRGAWLATAVGIGLLFWKWINRKPREIREKEIATVAANLGGQPRLSRSWCMSRLIAQVRLNWLSLLMILVSGFVLCFWQFRHTESPLLRRVFSVGNINDFSWRNRVTAWQGAGRMILDQPWVGFGWGKAEEVYRKEYRAERLEETAAIQLNDYLMIGISAGTPAVLCLLVYVGLVLVRKEECGARAAESARTPSEQLADKAVRAPGRSGAHEETRPASTFNFQLSTTAMAGALVLLIGFWFDGGLFKLPTCVVFWILLELARCSSRGNEAHIHWDETEKFRASSRRLLRMNKWQIALRWLAGIVAVLAVGQTFLHLGVPQLGVSPRTISIARHWLVPHREKADFEVLANYPASDWGGKPLKVLLQHTHLASYNRGLVNWKLDDAVYRAFVLSPEIGPAFDGNLNWRRPLWEYFYPRVRKETSLTAAAETVERQLHERVKMVSTEDAPKTIAEMWQHERASHQGFEAIRVAALRSVGIPARLSASGRAEFWSGDE